MNRCLVICFFISLFTQSILGAGDELSLVCTSTENPSKLVISMQAPSPQDDCDISYNHDCGLTVGRYAFKSDLSHPTAMSTVEGQRQDFPGTFSEPENNGLEISHEGRFELQFKSDFRSQVQSGQKAPVKVTSFEVTKGPGQFYLYCEQEKNLISYDIN